MFTRTVILLLNLIYNCIPAEACRFFLTISLDSAYLEDSNLEVNWGPYCRNLPEWVGVYRDDPSVSNIQHGIKYTDFRNTSGKIVTSLKIGQLSFPDSWNRNDTNVVPAEYPKGKCLPFYVAAFNDTEILSVECLKIQPNWMTKFDKHIAWIPLKDLFIPGTHASGSYYHRKDAYKSMMIREYAATQYLDIWSQLVFGIRYLDLSIGYDNTDKFDPHRGENFWTVNENKYINPLQNILKDVRRFVTMSHEIVILDFSSFPIGFYKHPERHADLFRFIRDAIGDLVYQRVPDAHGNFQPCYELSMNNITSTGRFILLIYPPEELPYPENESNILCPAWKRFTTSFMNSSQSLDYMRLLFSKRPTSPVQDEGWIFHAIRGTEQSNSHDFLSSRQRAETINPKLNSWLYGPWSATANVVAVDYFTSTDIIDIAIYANLNKAYQMKYNDLMHFEIAK